MGFADRLMFPTPPGDEPLVVVKEPVADRVCPNCSGTDIQRYPVAYYQGPRIVEKCQTCYTSLSIRVPETADNWPPYRPAAYEWEASPAEHASTPD